ncbi:hypothetical protein [Quadrisphaera sp. KR29]|uniref:hypothetical protein n=1 Tax=Quadrisphaera sp. KR29 TaxID=3461391 RepID=UPI0040444FE2
MSTPDRGALRAVRSAVLALLVVGLSLLGHAAAGGQLPGAAATAATGLAVLACCAAATRWHLPVPAAAVVLAGGQVVLHAVLERLAPTPDAHGAAHGGAHAAAPPLPPGLVEHAGHLAPASAVAGTSRLWLGGPSTAEASMLLAHLVVAVALALVYSRGEDALWALCAWLAPLAAVVVALAPRPVVVRRAPRPAPTAVLPGSVCVLRGVRRRGPPVRAAG